MTFEELKEFLIHRMSMSHIYQPLVVRALLENNGIASVRDIARDFLSYDEAQVEYYIRIMKRWPRMTLTKHGIISTGRKGFVRLSLNMSSATESEREELIAICNDRIREYIGNYKGIIGDYRYNPDDLSSSSLRYLVLKLAKGHCALCGASIKDTPIDIDHIRPRSKGGGNEISNLQALCFRCNRGKRDRDAQDFRGYGDDQRVGDCAFCNLDDRVVRSYNTARCIHDAFPVSKHHALIIPQRHVTSMNDLPSQEIGELFQLAKVVKGDLVRLDSTIAGFNFGINEGIAAGQSISHLHLHIIPRRAGDVADPRGGVRGVIPGSAPWEDVL